MSLDIYGAMLEARKPKGKYINWDKIFDKLKAKGVESYDIDIRYLKRWIDKYPEVFPKFMIEGRYEPYAEYNSQGDFVWRIYLIKKSRKNVK